MLGEYFDNADLTSRKLSRIDSQINFSWTGTETPAPQIADDTFSIRWTGKLEAQYSEEYTFFVQSDAGVRLWVNNQLLIDKWTPHPSQEDSATINLQAQQKYDIKLEYAEDTGDAEVRLSWSSPSQAKQVIPASRLFPSQPSLTYTYDSAGNRLSESGVSVALDSVNRTYSYDDLNRLTAISGDEAGAVSFTYDSNGNLTQQAQGASFSRYEYDGRDQMRRVLSGATGAISSAAMPSSTTGGEASGASEATNASGEATLSQLAAFDYDFERRRLSKTSSSETLSYVYAGSQVVNEFSTNGALVNRYDYGADLLRGEFSGEGERFYFADALGSITTLAQATGGGASQTEYDAWGALLGVTSSGTTPSTNRIGFTGQRFDPETSLMPLGNGERYYSPSFGQFTQQDSFAGSLSLPPSLNRHSYVHNNPLKFVDPSGHLPQDYTKTDAAQWLLDRSNSDNWGDWAVGMGGLFAYEVVDMATMGGVSREDRTRTALSRGQISLGEALTRSAINQSISSVGIVEAVATRGRSLVTRGAAGGASAVIQQFAVESYEMVYEGREAYSPFGDYAKTAAAGFALNLGFGLLEKLSGASFRSTIPKAPAADAVVTIEGRSGIESFTKRLVKNVGDELRFERDLFRREVAAASDWMNQRAPRLNPFNYTFEGVGAMGANPRYHMPRNTSSAKSVFQVGEKQATNKILTNEDVTNAGLEKISKLRAGRSQATKEKILEILEDGNDFSKFIATEIRGGNGLCCINGDGRLGILNV